MSRDEMLALAAKFERGSIVTCAFTDHEKLIAADALRLASSLLDGSGEKKVDYETNDPMGVEPEMHPRDRSESSPRDGFADPINQPPESGVK